MTAHGTPIVDATEDTLLDVDAKLATISTAIAGILAQDTTTAIKAEAIRALLAATLTIQGTVALDAAALAAIESISVQNFPSDFPDATSLAKLEAIRALLAGTLGIAGTVAVANFPALQAVSAATLPLPAGAATQVTAAAILAQLVAGIPLDAATLAALESITIGTALPAGSNAIGAVTANAGTNLNTSALALDATSATTNTEIGATNETAPAADTGTSSGLNGRLQRIAQRLTSIIALLPTALSSLGGFKVDFVGALSSLFDSITAVPRLSSVCTRTSVAAAVADTLLLAANTNRIGATISNDSGSMMYIGLGTAAVSPTNFTATLAPTASSVAAYFEVPFAFQGQVRGYWVTATGSARVSEITL